jgi:hypothetical protein
MLCFHKWFINPHLRMVLISGLCIFVFAISFIRCCSELQNAKFEEFVLVQLLTNLVMRFCQGVSKNKRINVTKCLVDPHPPTIDCPIPNVISTFKELTCWCLTFWPKLGFHPLFLHPWRKWKKANDIYFTTSLVGCNQLPLIVNHLTFDLPVLKEKVLSNQIAQGVDITRVEVAFIPHKYGMEVTSHLDPISYGKLVLAFILFFGFFLFLFLIIFSF